MHFIAGCSKGSQLQRSNYEIYEMVTAYLRTAVNDITELKSAFKDFKRDYLYLLGINYSADVCKKWYLEQHGLLIRSPLNETIRSCKSLNACCEFILDQDYLQNLQKIINSTDSTDSTDSTEYFRIVQMHLEACDPMVLEDDATSSNYNSATSDTDLCEPVEASKKLQRKRKLKRPKACVNRRKCAGTRRNSRM
ncbi:uncharacterized protein LOC135847226 [Planococcus citri]|uniref:uncharacterized protein LOC135847226 n=1 Tax=Planococcus citri TaxID=170843 RepID=UPI0031F7B60A